MNTNIVAMVQSCVRFTSYYMKNTIRIRVYKAKTLSSWSAFRNQETGREYSRLFPKANSKSEFSAEWCKDAQLAIQAENSRLYDETGRCSWTSGDYVSMPSKYYNRK